jgi:hypothetical protein
MIKVLSKLTVISVLVGAFLFVGAQQISQVQAAIIGETKPPISAPISSAIFGRITFNGFTLIKKPADNVSIQIKNNKDEVVQTVVTNANGNYTVDVIAGTYTVLPQLDKRIKGFTPASAIVDVSTSKPSAATNFVAQPDGIRL